MTIYVIIGLSVILLVSGVVFIIRGLYVPESEKAVPISDVKEIKDIKKAFSQAQERSGVAAQPVSLTEHFVKENINLKPINKESDEDLAHKADEVLDDQKEIESLKDENKRLEKALESEVELKQAESLSGQAEHLFVEQKEKLALINEEANKLKQEREALRAKCAQQKTALEELNEKKDKIEKDASILKKDCENQRLKLVQQEEIITESETVKQYLEDEKQKLASSLEEYKKKAQDLKSQVENAVAIGDQKINEANQVIAELKSRQGEVDQEAVKKVQEQLSKALSQYEAIKYEFENLQKEKASYQTDYIKIKEHNVRLIEKEKMLQYELTKSKAQTLGLQRICEEFKIQLEQTPA